jgi:hypothetical protein
MRDDYQTSTKKYRYETHLHTSEVSACSVTPGKEYIQAYKDLGYTGIIVTDHFFHGNTMINRNLPWEKFVDGFRMGYENAAKEGARLGLDVFFGWEENFESDEYLIYGLTPAFMLKHPEMSHWSRETQYQTIKEAGGVVIQAHPFRVRDYIQGVHLSPEWVDGIEIANAGNDSIFDRFAQQYAQALHCITTSGSDIHSVRQTANADAMFGIETDVPLQGDFNLAKAFTENWRITQKYPVERMNGEMKSYHPQVPLYLEASHPFELSPNDWPKNFEQIHAQFQKVKDHQ